MLYVVRIGQVISTFDKRLPNTASESQAHVNEIGETLKQCVRRYPFSAAMLRRLFIPNLEKGRSLMRALYPISSVVAFEVTYTATTQWLQSLTNPDHTSRHRLADLEGCAVVRVEHYRQNGPISHEIIVLKVCSKDDVQFIRLESLGE